MLQGCGLTLTEPITIDDGHQVVQLVVRGKGHGLPHRALCTLSITQHAVHTVTRTRIEKLNISVVLPRKITQWLQKKKKVIINVWWAEASGGLLKKGQTKGLQNLYPNDRISEQVIGLESRRLQLISCQLFPSQGLALYSLFWAETSIGYFIGTIKLSFI